MDKLSIKVQIAGRTYPLTINREEEEGIRKVAKEIDANIAKLASSYAVKDKQDLLAMTALQYGSKLASKTSEMGESKSTEMLTELHSFIDELNRS